MQPEVEAILLTMSKLLEEHDEESWASALARLAAEYGDDPVKVEGRIRALYGGMGSFSDIVLYRDGNVARDASRKLDDLRHRLFDLCGRGVPIP
jgi:hypothetical protein